MAKSVMKGDEEGQQPFDHVSFIHDVFSDRTIQFLNGIKSYNNSQN